MEENKVYLGDCLELMKEIPDKSVDMILCDLPYGTTSCSWDTIIPFEPLWKEYERITKDNAAIVLTASQPFTSALVMSNPRIFKYEWIWEKEQGVGFQLVKYRPLIKHESCLVFSKRTPKYNPQRVLLSQSLIRKRKSGSNGKSETSPLSKSNNRTDVYTHKSPDNFLYFQRDRGLHPTQKPVPLFEYLIKTYTNEGDLVLDNCAGSGTTAIACINSNRKYILMEKEEKYYEIIQDRIKNYFPAKYLNNEFF